MGGENDKFPAGMRVLLVDDNPICLHIIERLLQKCNYQVTTTSEARLCLEMLKENVERFDLVISDVYMPEMDGFALLNHITSLEIDIPVVMLSANDDQELVMKGVRNGASDYLFKPVRTEELKNIWQHVVRRKQKNKWGKPIAALKETPPSPIVPESNKDKDQATTMINAPVIDVTDKKADADTDTNKRTSENKGTSDEPEGKKPRIVWSLDLHKKFAVAFDLLGPDKACPKKILDLMNVEGLTRKNVASHLQKYRLYLKRMNGASSQSRMNYDVMHNYFDHRVSSICSLDIKGKTCIGMSPPTPLSYYTWQPGNVGCQPTTHHQTPPTITAPLAAPLALTNSDQGIYINPGGATQPQNVNDYKDTFMGNASSSDVNVNAMMDKGKGVMQEELNDVCGGLDYYVAAGGPSTSANLMMTNTEDNYIADGVVPVDPSKYQYLEDPDLVTALIQPDCCASLDDIMDEPHPRFD